MGSWVTKAGPNSAMRIQVDDDRGADQQAWPAGGAAETRARARAGFAADAHSFTRGSSATVTMSTTKLVRTTPTAKNSVTPCTMK